MKLLAIQKLTLKNKLREIKTAKQCKTATVAPGFSAEGDIEIIAVKLTNEQTKTAINIIPSTLESGICCVLT